MRKSSGKTDLLYGKREATSWLSWLARNMREYGTAFFIEQLEPSWLPTRRQQWVYLLVSRLVEGVLIGLIGGFIVAILFGFQTHLGLQPTEEAIYPICHGLLAGVVGGFVTSLADCLRLREMSLWARINKASLRWQITINIAMTAAMIGLVLLFFDYVASHFLKSDGRFSDVVLWDLIIALLFGLVLGSRNTGRTLPSDIRSVETLGGERGGAVTGGIKGLVFGIIFIIIGLYLIGAFNKAKAPNLWVTIIMVGLIGGLIGACFDGLRSQVKERKLDPNEGIKLSRENGIRYGGLVGLSSGLLFGLLVALLKGKFCDVFWAGLEVGLTIGLMGFLWYGGLEVIRHYTLRLILYFKGYMPLDYARFLDYAAERLFFLQKVGGGYEFIHRYLLEHFAELGPEDGSSVEESTP